MFELFIPKYYSLVFVYKVPLLSFALNQNGSAASKNIENPLETASNLRAAQHQLLRQEEGVPYVHFFILFCLLMRHVKMNSYFK